MTATILRVPSQTTPQQLVEMLLDPKTKVLYTILTRQLKLPHDRAEAIAPMLAREIVAKAEACASTYKISENTTTQLTLGSGWMSKEECDEFRKDLEELIVIRYKDGSDIKPMTGTVRKLAGKFWARLRDLAGSDARDWAQQQREPNSAIGHRG